MIEVRDRIRLLQFDLPPLLKMARQAEQIIFRKARDEWALPYVSGTVPRIVAAELVDGWRQLSRLVIGRRWSV